MGYRMTVTECTAKVLDQPGALAALKAAAPTGDWGSAGWSWIRGSAVREAATFQDALERCRWDVDSTTGAIVDFLGENIGDEDTIFAVIAPFMEPGGYIQMLGEDGERWRWCFDGKVCAQKTARVEWED